MSSSTPDAGRIDEVISAVKSAGAGTVTLVQCPLGAETAVFSGLPAGSQTSFSATVNDFSMVDGELSSVSCGNDWATMWGVPIESKDVFDVMTGIVQPLAEPRLSEPQPFFLGQAFTYCYTNLTTQAPACGAAWFSDRLVVHGVSHSPDVTAQAAADWLAMALPAMIGH